MGKQMIIYTHTVKYYSALNKNEILTQDITWMKLEDVMQSEMKQSQKHKHVWFYSQEVPGLSSQS